MTVVNTAGIVCCSINISRSLALSAYMQSKRRVYCRNSWYVVYVPLKRRGICDASSLLVCLSMRKISKKSRTDQLFVVDRLRTWTRFRECTVHQGKPQVVWLVGNKRHFQHKQTTSCATEKLVYFCIFWTGSLISCRIVRAGLRHRPTRPWPRVPRFSGAPR